MESVLGQAYPNLEYIIIDGGSTDGTQACITTYLGRIHQFISEPDGGIYDALNKGLRWATGDAIGFVHADDRLANHRVLADVAEDFARTGADGIYGDLEYVSKDDPTRVVRYWRGGIYKSRQLQFGWMPPHPTLFLKRSVYERCRLPNGEYFDTRYRIAADYDFMMRVLNHKGIVLEYLPRVLVRMRVGGASNASLKAMIRKSREDLDAMRRNGIGGIATLACKNLRKLNQFFTRA